MMKKKGFSLFWRAKRSRWTLSYPSGGESWKQHVLPASFTKADRAAALAYVTEFLAHAPAPQAPVDPAGVTWRQLSERWLAVRRQRAIKGSTMLDSISHLSVHILPTFGDDPAAALATSIPKVREWLRGRRQVLSASRVRGCLSTFRQFVDDAIAEEWVRFAGNPLRSSAVNAEVPALVPPQVVIVPMSSVQAILDEQRRLPLDWRVRCCMGFTTGMSDGEIAGLRWRDIDLDAEVPSLRVCQAVAMNEKGKHHVTTPKRPSRVRTIPLHAAAVAALREWRTNGAPVVLQRDPQSDDIVLCGPRGTLTRPASPTKLRNSLAALGLPQRDHRGLPYTFQAARRTFLTVLEGAGVSLERRQRLAGHSKASVTEQHYTADNLRELAADVAKVPLTWPATVTQHVAAVTGDDGSGLAAVVRMSRPGERKRIRKPLLYPLSYGGSGAGRGNLAPGTTQTNDLDAASGFGTGALVVPGTTPRVSAEIAKLAADLSMAQAFDAAIAGAMSADVSSVATALAAVARMDGQPEVAAALSLPLDTAAGVR